MRIELGGGDNPCYHPNIDAVPSPGVDIVHDLTKEIPLPDDSVDAIYSTDFYEHLTFGEGLALLKECKRCLVSTGFIEFVIPDVPQGVKMNSQWNQHLSNIVYGTRRNQFDIHKSWYDPQLIKYILENEGWGNVEISAGDETPEPKFMARAWKSGISLNPKFKVSVVCSTFRPGYIDTMVESLISQTMPQDEWEFILVDDLFDKRKDSVKEYVSGKIRNFKHISPREIKDYVQIALPFNTGLTHAEGELVYFMNDHSYPHPRCLARHWEIYYKYGPKVITSGPLIGPLVQTLGMTASGQVCGMPPNFQTEDPRSPIAHLFKDNCKEVVEGNYISILKEHFQPDWRKRYPVDWRLANLSNISVEKNLYENVKPAEYMNYPELKIGHFWWAGRNDSAPLEAILSLNGFDENFDGRSGGFDGDLGARLVAYGCKYLVDREAPSYELPRLALKKPNLLSEEERNRRVKERRGVSIIAPNCINLRRERCQMKQAKKLNIGSFTVMLPPPWINLDILDLSAYAKEKGFNFQQVDVTKGLPFEDNSIDFINSSHLIEHLTIDEGIAFLKECRRVLKPGGTVRIGAPDVSKLIDAYKAGKMDKFNDSQPDEYKQAPSQADKFWRLLTAGHKTCYDFPAIKQSFEVAGFKELYVCEYNQELDMFPEVSLYVEAKKESAPPSEIEQFMKEKAQGKIPTSQPPEGIPEYWRQFAAGDRMRGS